MRPTVIASVIVAALPLAALGCGLGTEGANDLSRPVRCLSTAKDPKDLGLRAARLRIVADSVKVTWTTDRPRHETAGYSIALTDDDGFMRRELSLFYVGEGLADVFDGYLVAITDLDTGDDSFPEDEPSVEGSTVTMHFPRDSIEREGKPFAGWYAGIDIGQEPKEDFCPDPPPGERWPKPLPLPAVEE